LRIAILTGGGDCPGLNAVIRAAVRRTVQTHSGEVLGISDGWAGLIEGRLMPLDLRSVSGILPKGGTILGTSRTNPLKSELGVEKILENIKKFEIDALIAVGGEDTLGVASKLFALGIKVVGVPKTIDNDLSGTDYTFGFDTAVNIATEAIDRLHTTAESHNRVMVVEVMGRHTGWIAVEAGIAGGADVVLIPEMPISVDEVCNLIKLRHERGKDFSIVVVAEGAKFQDKDQERMIIQDEKLDAFGHVRLGGIGAILAEAIEERTGFETRYTVLGHIQRGGTPTAFDRVLGTRFGVAAVDLIMNGEFGKMVSIQGRKIQAVPLDDAVGKLKTVDMELYEIAGIFFG
jgi:phosphofructokinase-like protein